MKKLTLIGPRFSNTQCGISVPFELLLDHLAQGSDVFEVIDSNSKNYSTRISMFISIAYRIMLQPGGVHVGIHATFADVVFFGPVLWLRRYLRGGGYSIRKFAGSFDKDFLRANPICRSLIRLVLRNSKFNFFETPALTDFFRPFNPNTALLPNVRTEAPFAALPPKEGSAFRVLFVGRVIREKGVLDLATGMKEICDASLTVVGQAEDLELEDQLCASFPEIERVYHVANSEISSLMAQFHCLALPSYYHGEGIPGVVVEAFMCGLPVIVSNWNSLPEIAGDGGIVVGVQDPAGIKQAVFNIRKSWGGYHSAALRESERYRSDIIYDKYLGLIGTRSKGCTASVAEPFRN